MKKLFLLFALSGSLFFLNSCEEHNETEAEENMEEMGEDIEDGVEDVGDDIEEGVEDMDDEMED